MNELLLGIDIGTSGCKITVIDRRGNLVDTGFGEYRNLHPQPGWSEQDPDDWHRVAFTLLRAMAARGRWRPEQVAALSLDGSTHNAVLADGDFRPLRPTIMWTDQRSATQAARLEAEAGAEIFRIGYQKPTPTWTLPQLAWIGEHDPQALRRTRHILFTKDYVRHRLTGTWETDRIEAQGSLLYDMAGRRWSEDLCRLAGIPASILPPLVEPTDVVGSVTAEGAAETGLKAGTPVVAGCSDSAVEDYAAGAVRPGQMIIKLATAGNVNVMTAEAHPHPQTLTYSHVIPGLWYTVTATNTAASAERWFRDVFCGFEAEEAARVGGSVYEQLHAAAREIRPGAEGLFFHPYLLGERSPYWDADLRGSFVGATMRHGKAHFVRALLEGVAYSLRDCYRTIVEMHLPVDEIRLIGGGAKSDLWTQIVSAVFARPVVRPAGSDASFGAALLAGVGAGLFADTVAAAEQCVRVRDVTQPDPQAVENYARLFPLYRCIHDQLAPTYAELSRLLMKPV
ncbi:MAG: xylulokinase [Thermoguttaceae bacterium]